MIRFLTLTEEAVFGTYNVSGTAINIRLSGDNAFTPMTNPEFWNVMDGSGLGIAVCYGSQTSTLTSTLTTELTYAQAAQLLGWACTRINSAQTAPWATSELPNDLASCTVDFAWTPFDSVTYKTKRFLGCKVASLNLTGSRQQPKVMASFSLVAGTPQGNAWDASSDPTLTAPALSTYPCNVVLFQNIAGNVSIGGSSRAHLESWSLSVQNTLQSYFDEAHFANAIRLGGRAVSASARWRLLSGVNDRNVYEQATQQACSWQFNVDPTPTHTVKFDMHGNCHITAYREDIPLTRETYYDWTIVSYLDSTATAPNYDLAVTVT